MGNDKIEVCVATCSLISSSPALSLLHVRERERMPKRERESEKEREGERERETGGSAREGPSEKKRRGCRALIGIKFTRQLSRLMFVFLYWSTCYPSVSTLTPACKIDVNKTNLSLHNNFFLFFYKPLQ